VRSNLLRMFFVTVLSLCVLMFFSMSMAKETFSDDGSSDDKSHDDGSSDDKSHDDGRSDDNCCKGKVTELTLQFNGADWGYVKVVQKKKNYVVYENTVAPGEQFTFTGTAKKGTLGSEISIFVDGVLNTKIHTSCSKPI